MAALDVTAAAEPVFDQVVAPARLRARVRAMLRESWLLRIAVALVGISLVLAVIGPYIVPYEVETATSAVNEPPSSAHWFGTDGNGFDVFSRVIAAARIDVTIGLVATAVSFAIGALLGLLTAYFRGWRGEFVMRVIDTLQAFPVFVLAIIVVVMTGRSIQNVVIVIALLNVPIFLRMTRSQVLSLRERTFVEAARAAGNTELSVAFRHVLPNALSPALAQAPITMGFAILVTAGLSFVGAGVQPPTPEWGAMIAAGADAIVIGQWWVTVFPGVAISLCVFGFAVVGEALRSLYLRGD